MRLAALALLLALDGVATAAPTASPTSPQPPVGHCSHGKRSCVNTVSSAPIVTTTLFSFAPTPNDPCTTHASLMSGSYVCLRGDGTSTTGAGITLTNHGTTVSGGANQFSGSGQYFDFTASASPADMTICAQATDTSSGATAHAILDKIGGASNFAYQFESRTGHAIHLIPFLNDSTNSDVADPSAFPLNTEQVACGRYHFLSDGTSTVKVYNRGAVVTTATNAHGPIQATASVAPKIGRNDFGGGSSYWTGSIRSLFKTDAVLTDDQVATASYTMGAPSLTVSNPVTSFDYNWTLNATASVADWTAAGAKQGVLHFGDTWAAADSGGLYIDATGHPTLDVYDDTGTQKKFVGTSALAGGSHIFSATSSTAGALSISVDGAAIAGTTSGTGLGTIRFMPTTMWLGTLGTSAAFPLGANATAISITTTKIVTGVVGMGDSLTAGTWNTAGASWPSRLQVALGTTNYRVDNGGVSGNTAAQIKTRWDSTWAPRHYTKCVAFAGINDILAGTPHLTVYNTSTKPLLDDMYSRCAKVVVVLLTPFGNDTDWTSTKQTNEDNYNLDLAGWCAANSGSTCLDERVAFSTAGDGVHLSVACDKHDIDGSPPDGLHLSDACEQLLATDIAAVL